MALRNPLSVAPRKPALLRFGPALASAALILVLSVPSLAATPAGEPTLALQPLGTQWAYGAVKNVSIAGTTPNGTYTIRAYFGWSIILNQTNTSATSFEIEGQLISGATYYVDFCRPTCSNPALTENLSFHGWESATAFANFTTTASVYTGGQPVPALGLSNVSSRILGNITSSATLSVHRGPFASDSGFKYFAVQVFASTDVALTPPLGLFPLNDSGTSNWNASSNYVSGGEWSASYIYAGENLGGKPSGGSGNLSGSTVGSGSISVVGANAGPLRLADGRTTAQVLLHLAGIAGKFEPREGFILIPTTVDLFGPASQPWSSGATGAAMAATEHVDVASGSASHLGLLASDSTYASNSTEPAASLGSQPTQSPMQTTGPVLIQAQPESIPAAESVAQCLTSGLCLPPAPSKSPVGGLLALGALLTLGVIVVALVVARKRTPPAIYPNARLYPPSTNVPGPSPELRSLTQARPAKPPLPSEEPTDPLGELW